MGEIRNFHESNETAAVSQGSTPSQENERAHMAAINELIEKHKRQWKSLDFHRQTVPVGNPHSKVEGDPDLDALDAQLPWMLGDTIDNCKDTEIAYLQLCAKESSQDKKIGCCFVIEKSFTPHTKP